ncbi:hypothetical protein Hanom_Chr17g01545811 [Helianthus anomalus]
MAMKMLANVLGVDDKESEVPRSGESSLGIDLMMGFEEELVSLLLSKTMLIE